MPFAAPETDIEPDVAVGGFTAPKSDWDADEPVTKKPVPQGEQQTTKAGYLSQLGSALATGTKQALAGAKTSAGGLLGFEGMTGRGLQSLAAAGREAQTNVSPEDLSFQAEMKQNAADIEQSKGFWSDAGEWIDYAGIVARNPAAAFKMGVQSAPNAIVSIPAMMIGNAAGGLAGAAAGIETGPGAIVTGIAGAFAGSSLANAAMEAGPAVYDNILQATNGEAQNWTADQFTAYIKQNPDVVSKGLASGAKRGAAIGAFDVASAGLAGKLVGVADRAALNAGTRVLADAGIDVANKEAVKAALVNPAIKSSVEAAANAARSEFTKAGNFARYTGATGIEMAGEGGGEAAAGLADTGKVDSEAVVQEMIGGIATGVPTALAGKTLSGAKSLVLPASQDSTAQFEAPPDEVDVTMQDILANQQVEGQQVPEPVAKQPEVTARGLELHAEKRLAELEAKKSGEWTLDRDGKPVQTVIGGTLTPQEQMEYDAIMAATENADAVDHDSLAAMYGVGVKPKTSAPEATPQETEPPVATQSGVVATPELVDELEKAGANAEVLNWTDEDFAKNWQGMGYLRNRVAGIIDKHRGLQAQPPPSQQVAEQVASVDPAAAETGIQVSPATLAAVDAANKLLQETEQPAPTETISEPAVVLPAAPTAAPAQEPSPPVAGAAIPSQKQSTVEALKQAVEMVGRDELNRRAEVIFNETPAEDGLTTTEVKALAMEEAARLTASGNWTEEPSKNVLTDVSTPVTGGGMETTTEEPDYADLHSYIEANHPQEAEASRYLDPSAQYKFHLAVWRNAGSPKLDTEEAPPTTQRDATKPEQMSPMPGILPGGSKPIPMAPTAKYNEALGHLRKLLPNTSLRWMQEVHWQVAEGVDPAVAAKDAFAQASSHDAARQAVKAALDSKEIESGPQAQDLYAKVYDATYKPTTPQTPSQPPQAPKVQAAAQAGVVEARSEEGAVSITVGSRDTVKAANPGITLGISRGEGGKRYTLWLKSSNTARRRWTYIRTLPDNKEEAIEAAKFTARQLASGQGIKTAFWGKDLSGEQVSKDAAAGIGVVDEELSSADLNESAPAMPIAEQNVGFGKHSQLPVRDLFATDPGYAMWIYQSGTSSRAEAIKKYLETLPEFLAARDEEIARKTDEADRIRAYEERQKNKGKKAVAPTGIDITNDTKDNVVENKKTEKLSERKAKDQIVDIIAPSEAPSLIPKMLTKHMFPMQVSGANATIAAMEKDGFALNGDGAGVGKTRQILAVAQHYADQGKTVVIITENAAIGKPWEGAKGKKNPQLGGSMSKDGEAMGVDVALMPDDGKTEAGNIYISTYNRVTKEQVPAGAVVIFDESQGLINVYDDLKDKESKWQEKLRPIIANAAKAAFYSATPADKPHQLAYLYKVLGFESPAAFLDAAMKNGMIVRVRKFGKQETRIYDVPRSPAAKNRLYKWVNNLMKKAGRRGSFIKREISYEGTDVQFHDTTGTDEASNPWAEKFNDVLAQMRAAESRGYRLLAPNSYILYAAELTKIGDAVRMVKRELAAGRKAVVYFSRINEQEIRGRKMEMGPDGQMEMGEPEVVGTIPSPVDLLRGELQKEGIEFAELHSKSGDTSKSAQSKFAGDKVNVLLASVESGGTGINLDDVTGKVPRTEVFMFAPYRGISTIQAMGRIWRASTIQDDDKPNRYVFVVASDIKQDAQRSAILAKKLQLMSASLGGTAVSKLPMSRVSYDPDQLVGVELPEEGIESTVQGGEEALSTVPLKPVNVKWNLAGSGVTWWTRNVPVDLLEWVENDGPGRTGLDVSVKKDGGQYVAFAKGNYQPEQFAKELGDEESDQDDAVEETPESAKQPAPAPKNPPSRESEAGAVATSPPVSSQTVVAASKSETPKAGKATGKKEAPVQQEEPSKPPDAGTQFVAEFAALFPSLPKVSSLTPQQAASGIESILNDGKKRSQIEVALLRKTLAMYKDMAGYGVFASFDPRLNAIVAAPGTSPSTLAHEVGHLIERTLLKDASPETQKAIRDSYERWLKSKDGGNNLTETDRARFWDYMTEEGWANPDAKYEAGERSRLYITGFKEWFADQVGRWASTNAKPVSLIDKFFSDVAAKLKQFFDRIQQRFMPDKTVADWLDQLSGPAPKPASKPPDTIKQGDKVKFKQEGILQSGTYQGVNADGTYSVQVKGEKNPRHVSARSLNENNDGSVVEGTRFSIVEKSNPLDAVRDQFGPRMSGHVNDNSFEEKVLGDSQALQRGYPEEFATIGARDTTLGRMANGGTGVRSHLWEHLGDLFHRAGSTTDYRNMRSKVENFLNQYNRYGVQSSLKDQTRNNAIYNIAKKRYGNYTREQFDQIARSAEGSKAVEDVERQLRFVDAAFASMYERMQAFTPLQAMGRNMAIAFGLRRYAVAKQLGEAILAAIEPNNDAVVTAGFNPAGVNNLKKSDNQTKKQWDNLQKIAESIEKEPLNSITVFNTISERISDEELLAPISGKTSANFALPTGNRAMPLDKARAHVYNKLRASPRKVRVINEPSLKFRGRYDPDGTITLNSAYLGSVEELNDVLLNHESIHDAIETDDKVRKQADKLLGTLTEDERADIEAEILDYKDGEFSAEQVQAERQVEAIRKLTANRPDLQTAWGRLVESVSLSFKKLLGVNVSRQQAELAAARILARGLKRLRKGKTGGRTQGGGSLYQGKSNEGGIYRPRSIQSGKAQGSPSASNLNGTSLAGSDAQVLADTGTGEMAEVLTRAARYGIGKKTASRAAVTASAIQGKDGAIREAANRIAAVKPLYQASPSDVTRFKQLTSSIPPKPTPEQLETWKQEHPAEYKELEAMRERVLREMGYTVGPVYHGTEQVGLTEFYGGWWSDTKKVTREFGSQRYSAFLKGPLADGETLRDLYKKFNGTDIDPDSDEPLYDSEIADAAMSGGPFSRYVLDAGYQGIEVFDESNAEVGMAYSVFNPSQIKSADPLATDDSGNLIPPEAWGDETSPDIRYASTNIPAAGSEDSQPLSPTDNSLRAREIREAAAGIDWGTATRSEKKAAVDAFGRKTLGRLRAGNIQPDATIVIASGDGESAHARFDGVIDGKTVVVIQNGYSGSVNLANAEQAMAHAYDSSHEEMIHALQSIAAVRRWKKAGSVGEAEDFVRNEAEDALSEIKAAFNEAKESGNAELASKIDALVVDSWNLYNRNKLPSLDAVIAEIEGGAGLSHQQFYSEVTRQLMQVSRNDFTTETGWQRFVTRVKALLETVINRLKDALNLAKKGTLGPTIKQEITDLETMMKDWESSNSKPFYSLPKTPTSPDTYAPSQGPIKRTKQRRVFARINGVDLNPPTGTEVVGTENDDGTWDVLLDKDNKPIYIAKSGLYDAETAARVVEASEALVEAIGLENLADALVSPKKLMQYGIVPNSALHQGVAFEVQNQATKLHLEDIKNPALQSLYDKALNGRERVGTEAGQGMGIRGALYNHPKYQHLFITESLHDQIKKGIARGIDTIFDAKELATKIQEAVKRAEEAARSDLDDMLTAVNPDISDEVDPSVYINTPAAQEKKTLAERMLEKDSPELLRLVNKIKGKVSWKEILGEPRQTMRERMAGIFDRVRKHEALQDLSPAEQETLTKELERLLQKQRLKQVNKDLQAAGLNLPKKAEKVVRDSMPELLRLINTGTFSAETFRDAIAPKFGLKTLGSAEVKKVEAIAAKIQDAPEGLPRDKLKQELVQAMSDITGVPRGEVALNVWVGSVLSGFATQFDTAASALNGLRTIIEGTGVATAKGEGKLAREAWKRYFEVMPRAFREALDHIMTGDRSMMNGMSAEADALFSQGSKYGHPYSVAEKAWRSAKEKGESWKLPFLATPLAVGRLMSAADHFNSRAVSHAMLPLAMAFNKKLYGDLHLPDAQDKANAVKQVEAYWGKPKSYKERLDFDRYVDQLMDASVSESDKIRDDILNQARWAGQRSSYTEDPTGVGGSVWQWLKKSEQYLEGKGMKLGEAAKGEKASGKKAVMNMVAFLSRFSGAIIGTKFARFTGNRINEMISLTPGIGLVRKWEKSNNPTREAMVYGDQAAGSIVALAAIAGFLSWLWDDDDDKDKWLSIEGSWSGLDNKKTNQLRSDGKEPYSIGIKRSDGSTINLKFNQWPFAALLATIGGIEDKRRYRPEAWNKDTILTHAANAVTSGGMSMMDLSSISALTENLGKTRIGEDPITDVQKRLNKTFANFMGGFIPRWAKDLDFLTDPKHNKAEEFFEYWTKEIPVYRRGVGQPMLDVFGQQVELKRTPWRRAVTNPKLGPEYVLAGKLASKGIFLPAVDPTARSVGKGKNRRELTEDEQYEFVKTAGSMYRDVIIRYGEKMLDMSEEDAVRLLNEKLGDARDKAEKQAVR